MIDAAPQGGPIQTQWGIGFRKFDACAEHIRKNNAIKAPESGITVPLPYTVYERPSYSIVSSNAIRRGPISRRSCTRMRKTTGGGTCGSRR
jgi:hypothetical protein